MSYGDYDVIPTLGLAPDTMNAEDLKKLAALTGDKVPSRKADAAALIVKHLAGERLRTVWECLDELQQAAVAEAVHSLSSRCEPARFRAKYGRDPNWNSGGESRYGYKPSALRFFLHNDGKIPADLKARLMAFVPKPREAAIAALDRLPQAHGRPYKRWDEKRRTYEEGTTGASSSHATATGYSVRAPTLQPRNAWRATAKREGT